MLKKKKKWSKSKKERQKWWGNLTEQQKDNYLTKVFEHKAKKRLAKEIKDSPKLKKLPKYKDKFCSNCFHHKTNNCKGLDNLKKSVCKSWFSPK